MAEQSIIWRRLDKPGHEAVRLIRRDGNWHLSGTAVFAHDQQPCALDYHVTCDAAWRTLSGSVNGWVGNDTVEIRLTVDSVGRWWLNATEEARAEGCIDLDLNFSPSTNLLPIRRLSLAIGQEAEVKAAWLRFPSFELAPLEQLYRRIDESTYRYESAGGSFVRLLRINSTGFVTDYPGLWEFERLS